MNGIHFCEICHNLTGLYVRESDNELVNYCKHCSTSRICDTQERCIYKLDMKPTDRSLSLNKNKYIRFTQNFNNIFMINFANKIIFVN